MRVLWYHTTLTKCVEETIINRREWDNERWVDYPVGELPQYGPYRDFTHNGNPRPGLTGQHICHAEWLSTGEPWPTSLPRTIYDRDGIPLCCRAPMPCEAEDCSMEPVNGKPASQHKQYAIDAEDADAATPFQQFQVAEAQGGAGPDLRGQQFTYWPLGSGGTFGFQDGVVADAAGVMQYERREFVIDADNSHEREVNAVGWSETFKQAGVTTALALSIASGVGKLGGTNLKIDAALLPAGVLVWDLGSGLGAGTTQGTATLINARVYVGANTNVNQGFRLPTADTGPRVFVNTNTSPVATVKLYPATGQRFHGLGNNLPLTVAKGTGVLLIGFAGQLPTWAYITFPIT